MSAWVDCSCGEEHWGPHGAAGLLTVTPDRSMVLLQQRSPYVHHGGTWAIPSGALDTDEQPYDGAMREAEEEDATAHAADLAVLGTIPGHQTDEWSFTYVLAEADQTTTDLSWGGDGEAIQHRWVPLDEVQKLPLHPQFAADWPGLRATITDTATELGPIRAWRAWVIGDNQQGIPGPVLGAPFTPSELQRPYWYPDGDVTAVCPYGVCEPPGPDCSCGIYAMTEYRNLDAWCFPADVVTRVELHGRIVKGVGNLALRGEVRATSATILPGPALISPRVAHYAPALSDRYGLELTVDPAVASPPASTRFQQQARDVMREAMAAFLADSQGTDLTDPEDRWQHQDTEVWPNLYLSGSRQRSSLSVDLLVTVCEPREAWFAPVAQRVIELPWPEGTLPATADQIESTVTEVVTTLNNGGSVTVCCHWGIERSAFIVALVLMELTGRTLDAVVADLRARRTPRVLENHPSPFWEYLRARDRRTA